MSVEEFPVSVNIPFREELQFNTLLTKYEDGKEQRRKKWSTPKRTYQIQLRGRTNTVMDQVWSFYNARSGAFDTFYFENPNESPVTGEIVGTSNGSTTQFGLDNFPLPSGGITSLTVGSITYTENINYTLARTTGVITFDVAPSGSQTITASYPFCRIVRFSEDNLDRELFNFKLYNGSMGLVQVL